MQVDKLNLKPDLEDALLTDAPNGPVDGLSRWSGTDNADGSALSVGTFGDGSQIYVEQGGHRAIANLPANANSFNWTVVEEYDVDDPETPGVEKISTTYTLAGTHSKASDPGGAVGAIPKGSGFPS